MIIYCSCGKPICSHINQRYSTFGYVGDSTSEALSSY